ncbi:WD40 repeat-like protein [Hortaea werneckii]|nr:WD40 repeat-like protein [Hortaea werneckii]
MAGTKERAAPDAGKKRKASVAEELAESSAKKTKHDQPTTSSPAATPEDAQSKNSRKKARSRAKRSQLAEETRGSESPAVKPQPATPAKVKQEAKPKATPPPPQPKTPKQPKETKPLSPATVERRAKNAEREAAEKAAKDREIAALVQAGKSGTLESLKRHRKAEKRRERLAQSQEAAADAPATPASQTRDGRPSGAGKREGDGTPATDERKKEERNAAKKARRAEEKASRRPAGELSVMPTPDTSVVKRRGNKDAQMDDVHEEMQNTGWSLSSPGGGRFIEHDPLFVQHPESGHEFLVSSNGLETQLLSIETSLPVTSCSAPPGRIVRCFAIDPSKDGVVGIAYDDGSVAQWDWTSGAPVQYMDRIRGIPKALQWSAAPSNERANVFALIKDPANGQSVVLKGGKVLYSTQEKLRSLQVLGQSEYILAHGSTTLAIGKRKDGKKGDVDFTWVELPMEKGIACAHARVSTAVTTDRRDTKRQMQLSLAVGNTEGQIYLYPDVIPLFAQKGQASLPSPRVLHWHRSAPSTITFSRDGNYLISGGKETVLVLWQLETGKKQYLPHLTSEIERVVVNGAGDKYAVQMGDNSITVLSTSELKPVANFAGIQMALPTSSKKSALFIDEEQPRVVATLNPRTGNELLLAVPSTQPKEPTEAAAARPFLQTFDTRSSRHITRQALARNNVTDFNLGPEGTPIAPPDVEHLAISPDGMWLASVDTWCPPASDMDSSAFADDADVEEERKVRKEAYLKFWHWDAAAELWTLSTRVDSPHARSGKALGAGEVFQLIANPAGGGFATVGEDDAVKIWRPRTKVRHGLPVLAEDGSEVVEWVCRRSVDLPAPSDRADSPMEDMVENTSTVGACLAFSQDGSLLAAVQLFADDFEGDSLVHFLDASTGEFKASKSGGLATPDTVAIGFLDRYFIGVTSQDITVWDLVTDMIKYRAGLPGPDFEPTLAINAANGSFAVARGKHLVVHKPTDASAVYRARFETFISTILAGKDGRGYTVVFDDATIRSLSSTSVPRALPSADVTATEEAVEAMDVEPPTSLLLTSAPSSRPSTHTAATQPANDPLRLQAPEDDDRPVVRPEQLASIFDVGQSFAMPPVRDMFDAVVGLFGRKPNARREVEMR